MRLRNFLSLLWFANILKKRLFFNLRRTSHVHCNTLSFVVNSKCYDYVIKIENTINFEKNYGVSWNLGRVSFCCTWLDTAYFGLIFRIILGWKYCFEGIHSAQTKHFQENNSWSFWQHLRSLKSEKLQEEGFPSFAVIKCQVFLYKKSYIKMYNYSGNFI